MTITDATTTSRLQVISEGTTTENSKIMVFCQTARSAAFLAQFFRVAGLPGVLEIHSRMSQPARTRASDAFRASGGNVVLFTSDVSARGVDYPDTTHIIQLGAATDRETYVHRLGRTARAGTSGEGVLLLTEDEAPFLTKVRPRVQHLGATAISSRRGMLFYVWLYGIPSRHGIVFLLCLQCSAPPIGCITWQMWISNRQWHRYTTSCIRGVAARA